MKRKIYKSLAATLACVLLAMSLGGCNIIKLVETMQQGNETLTSSDGHSTITIPATWTDASDQLNRLAVLEAMQSVKEKYVVVFSYDKDDVDEGMTHKEILEVLVDEMFSSLTGGKRGEDTPATIDGQTALTAEFSGKMENMDIVYWLSVFEKGDEWIEVVGWTLKSKADSYKTEIQDVMYSLKIS